MLNLDPETGRLSDGEMRFAEQPYRYAVAGVTAGGRRFADLGLTDRHIRRKGGNWIVTGRLAQSGLELEQQFGLRGEQLEETITLTNSGDEAIHLERLELGFMADLSSRSDWRLCAIPFRVQLNGSVHDYPVEALRRGEFSNAAYNDPSRPEPPLATGVLYSEAWAWGTATAGLVIMKYNPRAIELSVAAPQQDGDSATLRFGGAGFALYHEPSAAQALEPQATLTLGTTIYVPYRGAVQSAYACYRDFLDAHGHALPADYDPPVNWNELYDVGWYHSRTEELKQHYTREALLREAAKARDCGCELLYLDPGWEVAEGTTLWDEARLGPLADLVRILRDEYGLGLGLRTILRCYVDHWPPEYLVRHQPEEAAPPVPFMGLQFWELCLCNQQFWQEKLARVLALAKQGLRFMMVDEMDWRGPCYDPRHGHPVPTQPLDHVLAVYRMVAEVRRQCPALLVEVHDPVWPWHTAIYVPTYFGQGFGPRGMYEENWGFEYMWECLKDLRSGRALALYYYNLGCNIPLYLHITMAADNDQCIFFWWAASTVRHLGLGGKYSHKSIEPPEGLPPHDPERHFAAYREQMRLYRELKPYFVRGQFHGLGECIHLHTLPNLPGGVVNVFNLKDEEEAISFSIPRRLLNAQADLPTHGAAAAWDEESVTLRLTLGPMSPALIRIGSAVAESQA